mmetsp:Transcript_16566/g.29973  ORF Transcript_16566/g.29973 Transcript_16566/m.29973 type:complete len:211 (-) Transcript_16566:727-1359(-)
MYGTITLWSIYMAAHQVFFNFRMLCCQTPIRRSSFQILVTETSRCAISMFLTYHDPMVFVPEYWRPLSSFRRYISGVALAHRLTRTVGAVGGIGANLLPAFTMAEFFSVGVGSTKPSIGRTKPFWSQFFFDLHLHVVNLIGQLRPADGQIDGGITNTGREVIRIFATENIQLKLGPAPIQTPWRNFAFVKMPICMTRSRGVVINLPNQHV